MTRNGILDAQRIYTNLTRLRDVVNRLCREAEQLQVPRPVYFPLDASSALIHEAQEAAWVWMQELSKPADPKADTAILPVIAAAPRRQAVTG